MKITFMGAGSTVFARNVIGDCMCTEALRDSVFALYDIDAERLEESRVILEAMRKAKGGYGKIECYVGVENRKDALRGANFVVNAIQVGLYDPCTIIDFEIPKKYGLRQTIADTLGIGGIMRGMRTIHVLKDFAKDMEEVCPDAWFLNYTNPMALCVRALYDTFPGIKAFGCCHEVFGVQRLLTQAVEEVYGIKADTRRAVKTDVLGVNHFTWITGAHYQEYDVFDAYAKFAENHMDGSLIEGNREIFPSAHLVKFDLFRRYGVIAAAGDRHLSEFCPGKWYLESPEGVKNWGFSLTPVSWRKDDLKKRLERSRKLREGEEAVAIHQSGEEGVTQICALLGLGDLTTNVNLPNRGQIPNLPLGVIVETNATFTHDNIKPVQAGNIPEGVYALVARIADEQNNVARAAQERDLDRAFLAFANNPLVTSLNLADAKALFDQMIENTKAYLGEYFK